MNIKQLGLLAFISVFATQAFSAGVAGVVEEVRVNGDRIESVLAGEAEAASVGTVLPQQIEHRPILRPAEILETIPGMVITQHSGGGKANQYFLRGFNLDHSTDFANFFEGAPVNMVTHGHGQGYSDLNFLIPELLDRMIYKKGPYYAGEGDFSSAGSAQIFYTREKDSNEVEFTVGEDGYRRALFHGGLNEGDNHWVYAFERTEDDGPWVNPDELERDNAFLKFTRGDKENGYSIAGMYFDSSWNGTDQIPQRLVRDGSIDRFGSLDDDTGGDTHRYQLTYEQWAQLSDTSRIKANAYVVDYELSLTGDFTYYAGDIVTPSPVDGVASNDIKDQVTQLDDRLVVGGSVEWEKDLSDQHQWDVGFDLRYDDISEVGVGSSYEREIYEFSSHAAVEESSYALFSSMHSQWNDWFATMIGLRYDHFDVDVNDKLVASGSGSADDDLVSPSLSLHFGPFESTDIFLNYGKGFHSNDARGVVAGEVPLLSESEGFELGIRSELTDNLQLTAVLFQLDLDSELVFVGDDGTTEPKDASRRKGIELSVYYQPVSWFVLDADYTKSEARFKNTQLDGAIALGDYVPDSIEDVFSLGASVELGNGVYAGLRLRYFGPRNLTEDGEFKSSSSQMVNANIGYQFPTGVTLGLEVLNLTDREDDDITYRYASRTQVERENGIDPIDDYHSHPMIPRTVRATIQYQF